MLAKTLPYSPSYRIGSITVSFSGLEIIRSTSSERTLRSSVAAYPSAQPSNNNKTLSAYAPEVSGSSTNDVVIRLFY